MEKKEDIIGDIIEDNQSDVLIATFMGLNLKLLKNDKFIIVPKNDTECKRCGDKYNCRECDGNPNNYIDYNDWNHIQSVVEKIETMDYGIKMCRKVVEIYVDSTKEQLFHVKKANRKESLKKAIILFINYYNSLK